MKPKTQMRIGLWGVTTFFVLWFLPFIFGPPSSHVSRLSTLISLGIFAYYIGGISEKKIKTTRKAFRIWWILNGVVILGSIFLGVFGETEFREVFIIFIILVIFVTFVMWMGLRGLERILADESELDKTFVKNATLSELDKSPARNTTLKTNEPKWPGVVLLIILLVVAWFVPQSAWWGRIIFYILMALVTGCLCSIFPFMRKMIFGKSNKP
jgi:hypothetical protein